MEVIKIIREADIGESSPIPPIYKERVAARAVVFDTEGKVALLHVTKKGYHKLPGGGVEEGEDIPTALARELQEEIGCAVRNIQELGIIEEYRSHKFNEHQTSHCFVADLSGEKGVPHLDDDEVAEGSEPVWVSLEEAIAILDEVDVDAYGVKFMRLRDLTFLKEAQRILRS